ncbi:MAG: glutathione S-transferase [Acetobacterales bacterium]
MDRPMLVMGNRNYSGWSLAAWLGLRYAGIAFDEKVIPLKRADTGAALAAQSPSGRVPVLRSDAFVLWDSLAVLEYVAAMRPAAGLLPEEATARAVCRAAAAEMHSGFQAMRKAMPFNARASLPGRGFGPDGADDAARADVARLESLWTDCRERFGADGDFLFGSFSIADAIHAQNASRMRTYAVPLHPTAAAWVDAVLAMPDMAAWIALAREEPWIIAQQER